MPIILPECLLGSPGAQMVLRECLLGLQGVQILLLECQIVLLKCWFGATGKPILLLWCLLRSTGFDNCNTDTSFGARCATILSLGHKVYYLTPFWGLQDRQYYSYSAEAQILSQSSCQPVLPQNGTLAKNSEILRVHSKVTNSLRGDGFRPQDVLHSFFISTTHFRGRVTGAYEKSKKLGQGQNRK